MSKFVPYIKKYPRKDVSLGEILGSGAFGIVQKGQINDVSVALKIIQVKMKQDAELELNTIAQFSHRNILRFLGIIDEEFHKKPVLIFEFMESGSLNDFVSNNMVTDNILVSLVYDIACGMDYLHEMQYVHRDLAGRNVLVDSNRKAKVADFGLSRFLNTEQSCYYLIYRNKLLPVRWAPKESIPSEKSTWKFSFASDVWSFGVTMWEAWTKGGLPYRKLSDTSNDEVVTAIKQGNNPNSFEQPKCPESILEIMNSAFKMEPKERPSFAVLKILLNHLQMRKENDTSKEDIQQIIQYFNGTLEQLGNAFTKLSLKPSDSGNEHSVVVCDYVCDPTEVDLGRDIRIGEMVSIEAWKKKPSVLGFYSCHEVFANGESHAGYVTVTSTRIFMLRKTDQRDIAEVSVCRLLSSVMQITTKTRNPELIILKYGTLEGNTAVITHYDQFYVPSKSNDFVALVKTQFNTP